MQHNNRFFRWLPGLIIILLLSACTAHWTYTYPGPLPSWEDGAAKQQIIEFVNSVTAPNSTDYVPPSERIATFDNDGTLWSEKPTYFQLLFILDRVKSMAADHPEWQSRQPFQAVLDNDIESIKAAGAHGMLELAMATHAGITTDEFELMVKDWLATARHPRTGQPYTSMVYQPMLELLDYLRANEFRVFIVSGAGIEFMRPWTESVYGVPPEQVVGSSIETRYEVRDGKAVIVRMPELHFIDDKDGKPVGINRFIGRRPILAVGNSDGDFQMLQWTTHGEGRRLGILIHHTDAEREWAYDRQSTEGRLDKALDAAPENGWLVIDMAKDWRAVYPFE